MVVKTNTVSDPGAMMIHAHHTRVANRAVMGSWWPNMLAFETISPLNELLDSSWKFFKNFVLNNTPFLVTKIENFLFREIQVLHVDRKARPLPNDRLS